MSNKYIPNTKNSVIVTSGSNIDDLLSVNKNIKTFYFQDGDYYLTNILVINVPNIKLVSLSKDSSKVHIYQTNTERDGIKISSNNIKIKHVSLHVTASDRIALTEADANYSKVEYCYFYGCSTDFTVYYAGPSKLKEGQDTLNGYDNNVLDSGNIFRKNVIYAVWSGDTVSFSLQQNGIFSNNIIRGGKAAVYMCKSCDISNNLVCDSTSNGIFVSFPSHDLIISNNKIYSCTYSAIKFANQKEHGDFTTTEYRIKVFNNMIYDSLYFAIELNNASHIDIYNNKLIRIAKNSIYCLLCNNLYIYENNFQYFTCGQLIERCQNINVSNNSYSCVFPENVNYFTKIVKSDYCTINSNTVNGQIKGSKFSVSTDSTNITTDDNVFDTFYTFPEDYAIRSLDN